MALARIVDGLAALEQAHAAAGERFKAAAYGKVLAALRAKAARGEAVAELADLQDVPGIGPSIREKIGALLSGVLPPPPPPPRPPAEDELLRVHGIGPAKAKALRAAGIATVAELRRAVASGGASLTAAQAAGLRHYEDLLGRIPRAEMARHEAVVRAAFQAAHPAFQVTIVGSYRREAADSGDVDALVTLPAALSAADATALFHAALHRMKADGYLLDELARGPKKFMGIVRLAEGPSARGALPLGPAARRLDVLLSPAAEHAFALLYFTGSDAFNVAVRKTALAAGYSLNEHGLRSCKDKADAPPLPDEAAILAFLGLPFVPPHRR